MSAQDEQEDEQRVFVAPEPALGPVPAHVSLPESEFEFYLPRSHPINRQGFRYLNCAPSTTPELAGRLPIPFQRLIESVPQQVRFSWEDRSSFTYLTEDARTITTDKGWRAARANVGVREGCWYWEVMVNRAAGDGGSHARIGVGRREAPLNFPTGYDG